MTISGVTTVEPHATNDAKIMIHSTCSDALFLMVSPLLRDPLVDLLTLLCTGVPLPLPTDLAGARRGSDLSIDPNARDARDPSDSPSESAPSSLRLEGADDDRDDDVASFADLTPRAL